MDDNKLEIALTYKVEIGALKKLHKTLEIYHFERFQDNKTIADQISLLGTDYGKPNASETVTHIAKGNRDMFYELRKLIDKRIETLSAEYKEL